MRLLRRIWIVLALIPSLLLAVINLRLYGAPAERYVAAQIGPDVLPQLRFLRGALDQGSAEQAQQLFPEGFFFNNVLYGLAWVEVGLREAGPTPLRAEALREARWALSQLDLPSGRRPFAASENPPLGVFYAGWSNWLRGGTLLLEDPATTRWVPDAAVRARFEQECAALGLAFDQSRTPFLAAYPGQAWPVDSVVAVAALRLHDRIAAPRFAATIDRWLESARRRLDQATGLLPHRVDPRDGFPLEGARGSSQSIIARFLPEIDQSWAAEQYAAFRQRFVATPLGIPGVREYPAGVAGGGDVDSGPLIFGVSASATVVTLGAALAHGDRTLAEPILSVCEAFGLPLGGETKRYAFGLLPVGDAFLAWAKTGRRWDAAAADPAEGGWPDPAGRGWRIPFHVVSLLLLIPIWLPAWLLRRRERRLAAASASPSP